MNFVIIGAGSAGVRAAETLRDTAPDAVITLISGEALVLLYDARSSSSTHGVVQKVPLSEQGTRQLLIPAGVWHLTLNIGESEAFLINHPTAQYVHSAPDRLLLPWDSPEIPVDVAALFPVQRLGRTGPAAQRD